MLESIAMKIVDFPNNSKAFEIAQNLLTEAKKNEPEITLVIENIATILKATVVGLENKFKSKESLTRKLTDLAVRFHIPIDKIAYKNNDTLRYTLVFSDDEYANGFGFVTKEFKQIGYQIGKIWNAWQNEGLVNDLGYRGINITIISSQKYRFELQLHTEESFTLKTETHGLYEELRNLEISESRKSAVIKEMVKLAEKLNRPKGI